MSDGDATSVNPNQKFLEILLFELQWLDASHVLHDWVEQAGLRAPGVTPDAIFTEAAAPTLTAVLADPMAEVDSQLARMIAYAFETNMQQLGYGTLLDLHKQINLGASRIAVERRLDVITASELRHLANSAAFDDAWVHVDRVAEIAADHRLNPEFNSVLISVNLLRSKTGELKDRVDFLTTALKQISGEFSLSVSKDGERFGGSSINVTELFEACNVFPWEELDKDSAQHREIASLIEDVSVRTMLMAPRRILDILRIDKLVLPERARAQITVAGACALLLMHNPELRGLSTQLLALADTIGSGPQQLHPRQTADVDLIRNVALAIEGLDASGRIEWQKEGDPTMDLSVLVSTFVHLTPTMKNWSNPEIAMDAYAKATASLLALLPGTITGFHGRLAGIVIEDCAVNGNLAEAFSVLVAARNRITPDVALSDPMIFGVNHLLAAVDRPGVVADNRFLQVAEYVSNNSVVFGSDHKQREVIPEGRLIAIDRLGSRAISTTDPQHRQDVLQVLDRVVRVSTNVRELMICAAAHWQLGDSDSAERYVMRAAVVHKERSSTPLHEVTRDLQHEVIDRYSTPQDGQRHLSTWDRLSIGAHGGDSTDQDTPETFFRMVREVESRLDVQFESVAKALGPSDAVLYVPEGLA